MMARAALTVGASAIALALAEGIVRLVAPAYRPSRQVQFVPGPGGIALGPPNTRRRMAKNTGDYDVTVAFNELGLREAKPLGSSTPDSIFVVGDSFAFGWGVEEDERFSNLLQDRLGRPVFNISSAGADFDGYESLIRYAEAHGARIGSLVISVCMENDLHEYEPRAASARTIGPPAPIGTLKGYLTAHSAAYTIATSAIHRMPWLERVVTGLGLITPNLAAVAQSDISERAVQASAARLQQLTRSRQSIVLIIPSRAVWVGSDANRRHASFAHDQFVGQVRAGGGHVVDLRQRFDAAGDPLAFHFAKDGHWNRRGHALAAAAVADEVVRGETVGLGDEQGQ